MKITRYNRDEHFQIWDDFVEHNSINGTVFHTRKFLSYHGENKFDDRSIVIYENEKVIGVMLAAKLGNDMVSHPGTTGGGLVVHSSYYRMDKLEQLVNEVYDYFKDSIQVRLTEDIFYESKNNAMMLYLMGRKKKVSRELSMNIVICKEKEGVEHIIRASTRSAVRKYFKDGYKVELDQSEEGLIEYHEIVTENLKKFDSTPIHTVEDLLKIRQLLGEKMMYIKGVNHEGGTLGGLLLIRATRDVWHTQYIAKNYAYEIHSVVPAIIATAIDKFRTEDITNFNLGPCTEERGDVVNTSLAAFKESLGATAVNRYIIL